MTGFNIDSATIYDKTLLILSDTSSIISDISDIDGKIDTVISDISDVDGKVGTSSDDYPTASIFGFLNTLYDHIHKPALVYPSNADSVLVAGGGGAWAQGSKVEIIPVNTVTGYFDVHFVTVSQTSATDEYQLELYSGEAGSEVLIAQSKFYRDNTTRSTQYPIQTSIIAANTRISASLASAGGGDNTRVSLSYHIY